MPIKRWNGSSWTLLYPDPSTTDVASTLVLRDTNGLYTAPSATKLATIRTINGVNFDGTSNITVTATPTAGTVTNATLSTVSGEPGAAWTSYTATWGGISNGTRTSSYMLIGKTCFWRARFVLTSTSAVSGNFTVTLPFTGTSGNNPSQFRATLFDAVASSPTPRTYPAVIHDLSTTTVTITAQQFPGLTASYQATPSSTLPFSWTTDDRIDVSGFYEIA